MKEDGCRLLGPRPLFLKYSFPCMPCLNLVLTFLEFSLHPDKEESFANSSVWFPQVSPFFIEPSSANCSYFSVRTHCFRGFPVHLRPTGPFLSPFLFTYETSFRFPTQCSFALYSSYLTAVGQCPNITKVRVTSWPHPSAFNSALCNCRGMPFPPSQFRQKHASTLIFPPQNRSGSIQSDITPPKVPNFPHAGEANPSTKEGS